MILGSFVFHLCVSRRSLQLTLASVCWCWLGCFLLFSVGELNFDLFLTSSNNLTATVESNAATEEKKGLLEMRVGPAPMLLTNLKLSKCSHLSVTKLKLKPGEREGRRSSSLIGLCLPFKLSRVPLNSSLLMK